MALEVIGLTLTIVGLVLFVLELAHPGAFLLIPGSILLVAGVVSLFFSDAVLASVAGLSTVMAAAVLATIIQIIYYQRIAPTHPPMSTTTSGLTGQVGVLIADVVPDTLAGKVRLKSEVWSAHADRPIPSGTRVRVVSGEGVAVRVVPVDDAAAGG